MTEQQGVNRILQGAGQYPVQVVDETPGTQSHLALRYLDGESRRIQSLGWAFNTRYNVEIAPDVNGFVYLPTGTETIDAMDPERKVTKKGDRVYDIDNDTFVFTETLKYRVQQYIGFDCIPQQIAMYIAASAALRYCENHGDPRRLQNLRAQMIEDEARAKRFENGTANVNVLHSAHVRDVKGYSRRWRQSWGNP